MEQTLKLIRDNCHYSPIMLADKAENLEVMLNQLLERVVDENLQ